MRGPRPIHDSGFTVLEFVYASGILLVVAIGVIGAIAFTTQNAASSAVRVDALNLANQRIEQVRNMPYDNIGTVDDLGNPGEPPGSILTSETVDSRFTVQTVVGWARDPDTHRALYKTVRITVGWDEGTGGSVSVSSNVFGKSALVNTGDLAITVLDRDTGDSVNAARVTITPASGSARTVYSTESGEAFFGYLPTGSWAVAVTKAGYIFDSLTLPSATVTADLLTSVVAHVQRPSALRVRVTDSGGAVVDNVTVALIRSGTTVRTESTGADGMAVFGDLLVGTYQLHASASGRAPVDTVVNVAQGGQTYEVDLTMAQRAGLVVSVADSSGNALSGAAVRVTGPSPSTADIAGSPSVSGSNGEVSFGTPPDGTYTVTASMAGFGTMVVPVDYDGSNGPVQVVLSPQSSGSLTVHTVDNRGRSAGSEWVYVDGPNLSAWRQTTSTGYLTLEGLTPGSFEVTSYRSGRSYTVPVAAGSTAFIEVRVK